MKALLIIALLCIALIATIDGHGNGRRGGSNSNRRGGRGGSGSRIYSRGMNRSYNRSAWVATLCANDTAAQSFLTQTRQLIVDLRSNGSFNEVLKNRANAIAYLENADNTDIFKSNCTGFFTGLQAARKVDRTVWQTRMSFENQARSLFHQIIAPFLGNRTRGNKRHRYD